MRCLDVALNRFRSVRLIASLIAIATLPSGVVAEADSMAAVTRAVAEAEAAIRLGELELAESHYRSALYEGWLSMGALAVAEGRSGAALQAFERASVSATHNQRALRATRGSSPTLYKDCL